MQDTGATFKLRVNLVQVHVIVRDSRDKPVEGLRKEDFLVFDNGKLQPITTFGMETAKSRKERAEAAAKTQTDEGENPAGGSVSLPERFVAMTFDDIHLKMADAVNVSVAAGEFHRCHVPGRPNRDFLDLGAIDAGVHQRQRSSEAQAAWSACHGGLTGSRMTDCPDVSHYMADQIENKHDAQALRGRRFRNLYSACLVVTSGCSVRPRRRRERGDAVR